MHCCIALGAAYALPCDTWWHAGMLGSSTTHAGPIAFRRLAIGPIKLGDLAPGEVRVLEDEEERSLYELCLPRAPRGREPGTGSDLDR